MAVGDRHSPRSGQETQLDDRPIEFARVDNRVGLEYKFGYLKFDLSGGSEVGGGTLVKYDFENDQSEVWDFGKDKEPGELFSLEQIAPNQKMTDGLSATYNKAEDRNILLVLILRQVRPRWE